MIKNKNPKDINPLAHAIFKFLKLATTLFLAASFQSPDFFAIFSVSGGQLYEAAAATLQQSYVCLSLVHVFSPVLSRHSGRKLSHMSSYVVFLLCLKCDLSSL